MQKSMHHGPTKMAEAQKEVKELKMTQAHSWHGENNGGENKQQYTTAAVVAAAMITEATTAVTAKAAVQPT